MRLSLSDERKLVRRCVQQDKKAWDIFVDKYNRVISHSIVQTLNKYASPLENKIVDELFNTVFLSLLENNCKKLSQFQWKCKISSWLHLIAVHITIDYLRKQSKDISLDGETDDETPLKDRLKNGNPLPDDVIGEKEERVIFEQMKKSLTPREQLFLELYYNRELSRSEISRIMNITENGRHRRQLK